MGPKRLCGETGSEVFSTVTSLTLTEQPLGKCYQVALEGVIPSEVQWDRFLLERVVRRHYVLGELRRAAWCATFPSRPRLFRKVRAQRSVSETIPPPDKRRALSRSDLSVPGSLDLRLSPCAVPGSYAPGAIWLCRDTIPVVSTGGGRGSTAWETPGMLLNVPQRPWTSLEPGSKAGSDLSKDFFVNIY